MPAPVTPKTSPSFLALNEVQARNRLDVVLGQLSPVQRQMVLASLRQREAPSRIAARLGLPRDTARVSLAFAMAQLRMALSDAPLDKTREDWLERCRQLLDAARPEAAKPGVEIEWPLREGTAATSAMPPESDDIGPAGFFVVESRLGHGPPPSQDHQTGPAPPRPDPRRPRPAPMRTPAASSSPIPEPAGSTRRARRDGGLSPRLPAALAILVLVAVVAILWRAGLPGSQRAAPATEPIRVPPPSAEAAPLTAPDFRLVLFRQQHEGLLEDLDFFVWLAEQEDAP